MRIGILGHRFVNWVGGVEFLRTISESLACADVDGRNEYFLILPIRGPIYSSLAVYGQLLNSLACRLPKRLIRPRSRIPTSMIRSTFEDLRRSIAVVEIDADFRSLVSCVNRLRIDIVLPSAATLPESFPIPWIGYIADLQHIHLPQFFSIEERSKRDREFLMLLRSTNTLIVNAAFTAADIKEHYRGLSTTVIPLPFNAAPRPAWFNVVETPTYPFTNRDYFLISNQFWEHKDHATAFRAFATVLREFPDVWLVCTGDTTDFRNPLHFEHLLATIKKLGALDRIAILGLIPKRHQVALLRNCKALIQPTRFEGGRGGGATNDAIALGVPSIVSDIPINQELKDVENLRFFITGDAHSLATQMLAVLKTPQPNPVDPATLLEQGQQRLAHCGEAILEAAALCLNSSR